MWDTLWINVNLATMAGGTSSTPPVYDGAVAVAGSNLAFVGPRDDLPPGSENRVAHEVRECCGAWLTPGLIDCHTHIVYGGNRAHEFEQRLAGVSYEEIARAGGGILSTVEATRSASEDDLLAAAERRLRDLLEEGVTTVEIKSGYGLDLETELKMLSVARRLEARSPVNVRTTLLGAHALPPEYSGRPDDYVDLVCHEMIPAAASGLADAVDVFCENIAFTPAQSARVFEAARAHGLPVKIHAEQLSDQGGAALGARYDALSADHLEWVSEEGVSAMATAGTVAVLLPGAFYFLRETKKPPIETMRRFGVPIALATDCNPGSSPVTSLLLMTNMACTLFGLTIEEALSAVTRNGAKALGLGHSHGTLEVGKNADMVLWDIQQPADLVYNVGANPCTEVIKDGVVVGES